MCLWTWLHGCSLDSSKWNGRYSVWLFRIGCFMYCDDIRVCVRTSILSWLRSLVPSSSNLFCYFLYLQILSYSMPVMNVPDFTSHNSCLLPKPLIHHHSWLHVAYLSTFLPSHKLCKGKDSFLVTMHICVHVNVWVSVCVSLLLTDWRVNFCSATSQLYNSPPYQPSTVMTESWVWLLSGFLSIHLQDENMLMSKFLTHLIYPTV